MDSWMGNGSVPVSLNKYLYANIEPVRFSDPSGNIAFLGGISAGLRGLGALATRSIGTSNVISLFSRTFVGAALQGGALAIRKELRNCIKSRGKKCRILIPIVVVGNDFPNQREHIWDAQLGRGENFGGRMIASVLKYQKSGVNQKSWPKRNTPRGLSNSCNSGDDLDAAESKFGAAVACDEYPFSSSMQSGYKNYKKHRVSLRYIPNLENRNFGLRVLSRLKAKKGQRYIVAAFPWIPVSTVIDVKKGKR